MFEALKDLEGIQRRFRDDSGAEGYLGESISALKAAIASARGVPVNDFDRGKTRVACYVLNRPVLNGEIC